MTVHADPLLSAQHLVRRAKTNGKPMRVFVGFHGIGGRRYSLIAATSKAGITASLPNAVIEVAPDADAEKVAEILTDQWAVLARRREEQGTESTCVPERRHGWRTFGRNQRARA